MTASRNWTIATTKKQLKSVSQKRLREQKWVITVWSSDIQERGFGDITETDSDEFLAKRVFSSQDIPGAIRHPLGTLQGQKTDKKVRERVVPSKTSDLWWNSETK